MIVQDLLKKVKPQVIWNIYCKNYYNEISRLEWKKFNSYESSYQNFLKAYNEAINYSLTPNLNDILIARNLFDTDEDNNLISTISVSLIQSQDVEKFKDVLEITDEFLNSFNFYGILFIDRKDVLSYSVSETSFNYCKLEEFVADVFWEMTWFGYDYNECTTRIKKEEEILTERVSSLDSGIVNTIPIDNLWDELGLEKHSEIEMIEIKNTTQKAIELNRNINKEFFIQLKKEVSK